MKDEADKKVYCTNMDEDDPIIEKFLKEYLKEKEDTKELRKSDDLMVNFDITYADGKSESYTCGSESEIFGNRQQEEAKKVEKDERDEKDEYIDREERYYSQNNDPYDIESEIGKWTNCVDEWCKYSKKEKRENPKKDEHHECKCETESECKGKITVYSILSLKKSTTLKGVTVNLYKINGVKPELIESCETDEDGMALFKDVKQGSYRIIQLIDKRYFEKPVYLTWNEVNITEDNKEYMLYVLNSLKDYKKN